jgi:GNAT superfamily N-acetyltransferase
MTLQITTMRLDQKSAFADIWIPWLEATMGLSPDPEDARAMADPLTYYGMSGGAVFLASLQENIVGAVAVKGLGEAGFEFCKLVVSEPARGHGAGRAHVAACLDHAIQKRWALAMAPALQQARCRAQPLPPDGLR